MSKASLHERLNAVFANRNGRFLFSAETGKWMTYGEFEESALRIAETLRRLSPLAGGPRIAVLCDNSAEVLAVYWAALLLGGEIVPVDVMKGREEISRLVREAGADVVVSDRDGVDVAAAKQLGLGELLVESRRARPMRFNGYSSVDFDGDFLTVFTSGSTGTPKGIVHSFGALCLSAIAFASRFGFSRKNTFFHNFPMSYMAGVLNTFVMPLLCGSRIVVGARQSVAAAFRFWPQVAAGEADTFWFNPTFCNMLLQLDRGAEGVEYCGRHAITACIGTAPLDNRTRTAFEGRYGVKLHESFGLSETLFLSTNSPFDPEVPGSVGRLLDGVDATISEDGELLVDAPWLLKGYARSEEAVARPFRTGDLGHVDGGGRLFITGRRKDLIIKGGINVSPGKIEAFLAGNFPGLGDVSVVGHPDPVMGERTVCFFTGEALSREQEKSVDSALRRELGRDYAVDAFFRIDRLPLTSNGKVDKPALRKWRAG